MEEQDWKFICRFCEKKFPCGKSLGGHTRSHGVAVSSDNSVESSDLGAASVSVSVSASASYGLRENPKKSWRASSGFDSKAPPLLIPHEKMMICKQCGKGFRSPKALCGHMACHSEKDRGSFFKDGDGD
ncbi:hypothetical protein M569_04222, partial [Genlisea aurea]